MITILYDFSIDSKKIFSDVSKYMIKNVAIITNPIINEPIILLTFLMLRSIAQNSSLFKNLRNCLPIIKGNKYPNMISTKLMRRLARNTHFMTFFVPDFCCSSKIPGVIYIWRLIITNMTTKL